MRDKVNEARRRVDSFLTVEGLKSNWAVLSVVAVFFLALWIRYLPEQGMEYLQALDPFMIFRVSQHFALDGNLPQLDFLRYFPYPQPSYRLNLGNIVIPAVMYWLGPFLVFDSYLEWAQFAPALMGSISVVFAYLFGKEVWNKIAGVSGAFFLATIAGVMQRSSAGFFEKEPIGTMFMMASLYFFVRAWKRDEWKSGLISGLSLGLFTASWGGSKMLWLLYPMVTGIVVFIDEDVQRLLKAYTPTVIIGGLVVSGINPQRFGLTEAVFLANLGLVGLIWSRYLVEELSLIQDSKLKYYIPSVSAVGLLLLLLSPLYSNFLASKVLRVWSMATQSGGKVIAGTVAENSAAGLGQIVYQLGSQSAVGIHPVLGALSNVAGTWPLAFISIGLMGTSIAFMFVKRYTEIETIEANNYYLGMLGVFTAWVIAFAFFFQASVFAVIVPPILAVIGGLGLLHVFNGFEEQEIEMNWYYLLPFLWALTNILGAVSKSRLIFLAAFPAAVVSGYTVSVVVNRIRQMDFEQMEDYTQQVRIGSIAFFLIAVFSVSAASGYIAVTGGDNSAGITGSPGERWMQTLDYMRENTSKGEVMLSWWDYGYWFESVGRRPAVADGGNMGFYTSENYGKVNYPIADFLTSSNPENHTELFEKHSVDYMILDNSMLGKYAAVSQISNRDNSKFESMLQFGTPGGLQRSVQQSGNETVLVSGGLSASIRNLRLYTPVDISGNSVDFTGTSTLETSRGRLPINCYLTEEGRVEFEGQGSQFCIAEDPYRTLERSASGSQARLVLVPQTISESSLVRLYLMDGYGVDFMEKVPEASNGYVKMWKVEAQQ